MSEAICVVCNKSIAAEDQVDHLASQHRGPHYFWFNCRPFRTMHPSMRCADLVRLVGADLGSPVYEERGDEQIFYGHVESIDLTHKPQLFTYKTGTMWRGLPT